MTQEVFEILDTGVGAALQDRGRNGWRRFGVPPGGAMDDHAMRWANRLLGNPIGAPVLEFLLQGARLRALRTVWIAVTGADAHANIPTWRRVMMKRGDIVEFPHNRSGVWTYLAVDGGFEGERILGSASVYPRGGLGALATRGQRLRKATGVERRLPSSVAARFVDPHQLRNYDQPPTIRVWRGPQWALFHRTDRDQFFMREWIVSSQSDRVGYRLLGEPLRTPAAEIISEPVLVGSIQLPPNGQPIVTMRDGPTIGGYPKIGLVDPDDVSWFAQCRPGTNVRFSMADTCES